MVGLPTIRNYTPSKCIKIIENDNLEGFPFPGVEAFRDRIASQISVDREVDKGNLLYSASLGR